MECFILQRSCWKLCTSLWILTWGIIILWKILMLCIGYYLATGNPLEYPSWFKTLSLPHFSQYDVSDGIHGCSSFSGKSLSRMVVDNTGPFILQASPILLCSICPSSFTRIASQNTKRRKKPNSSFSMSLFTNNLGRGRWLRLKLDFLAFPLHIFF